MSENPTSDAVRYEFDDGVALVHFDDGKANALSHAAIAALDAAFDRAEKDGAKAVVLAGRPGRFSAGFDLSVMRQGPVEAMGLAFRGGELAARLYEFPAVVILAVTGHALAMGAVLCCAADERIGAEGDFKVGLNEVAIGMVLPGFALELAQDRLSKRHLTRAAALAEIYTPAGAVDAGYLDRIVPADRVIEEARARAAALAQSLQGPAHVGTKRALRAATLDRIRQSIAEGRAQLG